MIIHQCEQRSDEWKKLKAGKISGTGFGNVLAGKDTARRKDYLSLLRWERREQRLAEFEVNEYMQWGIDHEEWALNMYGANTDFKSHYEAVGFVQMNDYIGVSPDGLVDICGMVEIKCPKTTTHEKYIKQGREPAPYRPQIQGQMWVCERQWCDFVSYDPRHKTPLFIHRVCRDDEYIKRLSEACDEFIQELQDAD